MARVQFSDSWTITTSIDIETAKRRLRKFLNQHSMKLVSTQAGEITCEQGSQLTTRLLGGWFVNPMGLPKRARIRLHPTTSGIQIEAAIEETLGVGWLDPKFQRRYEDYFREWMDALRSALPPTSESEKTLISQGLMCPKCFEPVPAGTKFCPHDGTPISRECPKCKSGNVPIAQFCANCGSEL